jgi:cysteine-rich repeat protein
LVWAAATSAGGAGGRAECRGRGLWGAGRYFRPPAAAAPEECDDGNVVAGDGCDAACQSEIVCGDGATEGAEVCDDGNTAAGDGCRADCLGLEVCGDGLLDDDPALTVPEECDDGNQIANDACRNNCTLP